MEKKKDISYGIIGNNWGNKIFKILNLKGKRVYKIRTFSYFDSKTKYFDYLSTIIKKKKINIIWLAINPYKNYSLINFFLRENVNMIVEKPWLISYLNTKKIISILKKKKLKIFIHFEFLFLNLLRKIDKKNIKNIEFEFFTKLKKKSKIPLKYEFGSHLAAIKLYHFSSIKNVKYYFGYNKIGNKRRIVINYKSKSKILDFSHNKSDIIGKFINFVETSLCKNNKNYLDLNFALKVNEELK